MRTQQEILDRIKTIENSDLMGSQTSDLVDGLDYENAKPFLIPETTEEQWNGERPSAEKMRIAATDYLVFAAEKAMRHRGLSSSRAVDHFRAWVFLLGTDDDVFRLENTEYAQYGVPQMAVAAEILGASEQWAELIEANPELARMAEGQPCVDRCDDGCGW